MLASVRSKNLLNQLRNKEIDIAEFMKESAYWAINEGFDELKPKTFPTKPPRINELEHKEGVDWNKVFNDYPEVKGYYDLKWKVINWNRETKDWLEELSKLVPPGDIPTQSKIKERLELFKEKDRLVEKAKETFKATEIN